MTLAKLLMKNEKKLDLLTNMTLQSHLKEGDKLKQQGNFWSNF